jgi:acyl-[acyl carrier protein]--UDP-N-acetylglucosamine O-acyltransferase
MRTGGALTERPAVPALHHNALHSLTARSDRRPQPRVQGPARRQTAPVSPQAPEGEPTPEQPPRPPAATPQKAPSAADVSAVAARGLSAGAWVTIVIILTVAVAAAIALWVLLPGWVVDPTDYKIAADQPNAGALDPAAASNARLAARAPTGVLAGAIVAAAAAATGLIVSNHNARLTRETNDLTRRRDENAVAHNNRLVEREQDRADDDRFTTSIGQLGNTAASVRLGGLHSLHRLAQQRSGRLPTILDILSAYLRQPFHHPDHDEKPPAEQDDPTREPSPKAWWPKDAAERDERDAEAEVRRTALRLLTDLLPDADSAGAGPDINLRAAAFVGGWRLIGKKLGTVDLTGAHLSGSMRLRKGASISGELVLGEGASIGGELALGEGASIGGELWLGEGASIGGSLLVGEDVSIGKLVIAGDARISGMLWLGEGASIGGDLQLGEGASIGGSLRLGKGASIGGDLLLGEGASIGGSLRRREGASIGGHLHLEEGASIGRALALAPGAKIGGTLRLEEGASIGRIVTLGEGASIGGIDAPSLAEHAEPGPLGLQGPLRIPAVASARGDSDAGSMPNAVSVASADVDE